MLVSTQMPLTSDLLPCLSAGAIKLWHAVQLEPNQPQARYVELVGLCKRRVRDFTRELLEVGLVQRTTRARQNIGRVEQAARVRVGTPSPDPLADLSDAERGRYDALRAFGVDERGSRYWAKQGDQTLIDAALAFTRERQGAIHRPAAYLVWCLNHPAEWYCPALSACLPSTPSVTDERLLSTDTAEFAGELPVAPGPLSEILVASPAELALATAGAEEMTLAVPDDGLDTVLMAYTVEAATGTDVRLSAEARQTVQVLQQAGYTAEDVALFAEEVFPKQDWRGQKGERPTLRALTEGIATVRHENIRSCAINAHSLVYRVKALREHLPEVVRIHTLADLWSAEVQQAVDEAEREASTCPACALPISICRCGQAEIYGGEDAKCWRLLTAALEVQLGRATFDTWVRSLRLVGFEPSPAVDKYIVECKNRYQYDWVEKNLLGYMTERLSTAWAQQPSYIELRVAPRPGWMGNE